MIWSQKWWMLLSITIAIILLVGIALQSPLGHKGSGVTESIVGSNGLRFSTSMNATVIKVGERLNISVSEYNTLPSPNRVPAEDRLRAGDNWTFYGIPVSTWPACTQQFRFNWPFPVSIVVLKGNLLAQNLSSVATDLFQVGCASVDAFPEYYFEPNSTLLQIGYFAGGGVGHEHLGQYRMSTWFTMSGYWDLAKLASLNETASFCVPPVPHSCLLPPSNPFVPGVYTIGVADEWGQTNVLHFSVEE